MPKRLAGRTIQRRSPLLFPSPLITPPSGDYLAEFYDTRRGFGKTVDAGYGSGWTILTVTSTADSGAGTLRAALATTGKTIVRFASGLGSIVDTNRIGYPCTSDTLLDGHGYTGTIYGFINASNCDNFVVMYLSVTQPFKYGTDPSGGVFTASNCPRAYIYRCNGWDTGDIIVASGAYDLAGVDQVQPYHFTVDQCRLGPNPSEYGMMAPIRGTFPMLSPGRLNGVDNDARNGKCMNCAYDHAAVAAGAPLSAFDHAAYGTMVNNVMQGCFIRNGKGRSETVDIIGNLVAKYGTPYDLANPTVSPGVASNKIGIHHGGGSSCDDNGTVNIEGNVYIPYNNGEQMVGWQDAVADAHGMPHIRVGTLPDGTADPDGGAAANNAIKMEGKATTTGNARVGLNYVAGQTVESAKFNTGFDRAAYYTLPVADVSSYPAAQALVAQLEDNPTTRSGNPFSTLQPPNWRDVHTGPTFPVI